jgi:hypothetical protein
VNRPTCQGIVCAAVLVMACATALAEEQIAGDGYSLRIPGGFRRVPLSDCGT